ncbi:uncharacterized protein LOC106642747 [Copidosoma floridanum]|uniref:uncharacterized protein LOC106642747 n=1 Tax=Copidosoma floridanum TaxID=29053 RepID=UPI0006C99D65|nr:uncharacterized protein LOC106642747 [Copidosoma floridanum]
MPLNSSNSDGDCVANKIQNSVTPRDVALVAQRFTEDPLVQVLKYDLGNYSSHKLGFLGSHRQLTVEIKRKDESDVETLKLFVKSVPHDSVKQVELINDLKVFEEEYNFFNNIVPQLLKHYVGEQFAPTCYLSKPDSLIMEDLRRQNYQLRANIFDCYQEVKSVLSTLARFHASSIIAEAELTQLSKKPVSLKEHYPDHLTEKFFDKDYGLYEWVQNGMSIVYLVGEKLGHDPQKLRKGFEKLQETIKPSEVHRNVITHNDLWTNNIMFDDSKPTPKSILVDFQMIRYGPQVLDVLELLYFHTSRDFRKTHEKELVQIYQSVVEETVKMSKMSGIAKVSSLQETVAAMDDLRIFGPGMASVYLPVVLIDQKTLKDLTKESIDSMTGDRIELTLDLMEKNKLYKDRIKESVDVLATICNTL